jgi:hypothetical protein
LTSYPNFLRSMERMPRMFLSSSIIRISLIKCSLYPHINLLNPHKRGTLGMFTDSLSLA